MNEPIHEKVSVVSSYNRESGLVMPRKMRWQGRDYTMKMQTYHHKVRRGRVLLHVFHVTDGVTDFRLELDTETLHWRLEELCDGSPS